jgi:hypothetical protein
VRAEQHHRTKPAPLRYPADFSCRAA